MRKLLGYILLAISCLAWLTVPIIPFLSLSAVEKASWAGGIIIFAEIAWWLAMPLLGKEIIAWCKSAWQWCKRALGFRSVEAPVDGTPEVVAVKSAKE
ncbi:MAG: transporter suffix domain-containing protein [Pseudomonadales bacterium]|nr:transporter suffix domain-containing protein [Pseudomonadales bacterium]